MVNPRELRDRWTPQRAAEAKAALGKSRWTRRKAIEKVAFGRHAGRWDLRSLPIHTGMGGVASHNVEAAGIEREYTFVTLDKPPEFHDVKWESIDFSFAEIDHLRLFLSEVRDCLFIGGTFRDWRNWGVQFSDCDFSLADLQNSNIGGAPHNSKTVAYTNCTWRKGNLKNATLSDGRYRDCRFEDVTIVDQQIRNASFIDCSFSGRLREIRFDGRDYESEFPWKVHPNALIDCDLSECVLDDVEFLGIDTRTIGLPAQGQRIPGFSALARRAFEWISTAELESNESRYLEMYWKGYVTQLPDDAEGWLDLDALDGRARELVDASMAGSR